MSMTDLPAPQPLTDKQRVVLSFIVNYYAHTGEPCSVPYLARKLGLHRNTVMDHLRALRDKGSLPALCAPRVQLD